MHQIEVDVVGLKLMKLFLQQCFHVRAIVDVFRGHLGGDGHALAIAVPEGLSQYGLGGPFKVDVGGVQIGHTAVNGAADEADGLLLVDNAVAGRGSVEAHAAQAKCRSLDPQLSKVAVFHRSTSR